MGQPDCFTEVFSESGLHDSKAYKCTQLYSYKYQYRHNAVYSCLSYKSSNLFYQVVVRAIGGGKQCEGRHRRMKVAKALAADKLLQELQKMPVRSI